MLSEGVRAVVWKESLDRYRNRWIQIASLSLALFTLLIAYFGGSPAGVVGFQKFEAILVSLMSLINYFVPLIALLLGAGAIAEERERGTFEIILASVISPWDVWMGKFLGHSLVLIATVVMGLIPTFILLTVRFGAEVVPSLVVFLLSTVFLGLSLLALSFLLSVLFGERARIVISAVFLWLLIVILYDLFLLGTLILTKGMLSRGLFTVLLLANPTDVFRIINLLSVGELKAMLGFVTVELPQYLKLPVLWAVLLAWIALPVLGGYVLFKRRFEG